MDKNEPKTKQIKILLFKSEDLILNTFSLAHRLYDFG